MSDVALCEVGKPTTALKEPDMRVKMSLGSISTEAQPVQESRCVGNPRGAGIEKL